MDPILTTQIVIVQNNKVLLVKHGASAGHLTGVYGLPGGRPDGDEEMQQTVVRELKEESGLTVKIEDLREFQGNRYTADIKRKSGETKRYTMRIFYATEFVGDLASSDETTPEWIEVGRLSEYNLLPNVEKAVLDVIKQIHNEQ